MVGNKSNMDDEGANFIPSEAFIWAEAKRLRAAKTAAQRKAALRPDWRVQDVEMKVFSDVRSGRVIRTPELKE